MALLNFVYDSNILPTIEENKEFESDYLNSFNINDPVLSACKKLINTRTTLTDSRQCSVLESSVSDVSLSASSSPVSHSERNISMDDESTLHHIGSSLIEETNNARIFSPFWSIEDGDETTAQAVEKVFSQNFLAPNSEPWGIDIEPLKRQNYPTMLEKFVKFVIDPHTITTKEVQPKSILESSIQSIEKQADKKLNTDNLLKTTDSEFNTVHNSSIVLSNCDSAKEDNNYDFYIDNMDNIFEYDMRHNFSSDIASMLECRTNIFSPKFSKKFNKTKFSIKHQKIQYNRKLYYFQVGAGTIPVLLLHGLLMTSNFWLWGLLRFVSDYSLHNFKFICPDLIGYGESVGLERETYFSVEEQANRIITDVIVPNIIGEFHIIAHSFGCLVSCEIIKRFPNRIRSILFFAPAFFPSHKTARECIAGIPFPANLVITNPHFTTKALFTIRLLRSYIVPVFQRLIPHSEVPSVAVADFFECDPQAVFGTVQAIVDYKPYETLNIISFMGKKIKVLHPSRDSMVPLIHCKEVCKYFQEFIEFEVFKNAQHHFPLAQAKEVSKIVERYLFEAEAKKWRANSVINFQEFGDSFFLSSLTSNQQKNL